MRLSFDQNLSPRLRKASGDRCPDSLHVRDVGLESADDSTGWAFAKERGYMIVSKDVDFRHLGSTYGPPPEIVWIRRGNCPTREIERLLRERYDDPGTFYDDEYGAVLALL